MESNTEDQDPWLVSRELLTSFGTIQPVFPLAVLSLMSDYYKSTDVMSPASMFFVNRLMRSPTMKAVVYHAVLTFHGESIANTPYLSSSDLVRMFRPGDLAALIGLAYYFRTVKKIFAQSPDEELWRSIADDCQREVDLGGYIGYCIQDISAGLGMISRGFIPLAHSLFLCKKPSDKGREYLRAVYQGSQEVSFDYETALWGCSCMHLIGNIIQLLGYGMPWMNAAVTTYSSLGQALPKDDKDKIHSRMRYAILWIDTLHTTGRPPAFKIPACYYPPERELFRLLYLSNSLREEGSKFNWLERGRNDISPSATPQLFQEYLAESAPAEEIKTFCHQHIAPELLDGMFEGDNIDLSLKSQETIDF